MNYMNSHINPSAPIASKNVILIFFIVFVIIVGGYIWQQVKQKNIIQPTPIAEETESQNKNSTDKNDWQIYQDPENGFSIQYPRHWEVFQDETQSGKGVGFSAKELKKMPDDYGVFSIVFISGISLNDFIEKYRYLNPLPDRSGYRDLEQKPYILDGVSATKLMGGKDDGSDENIIFARHNDKVYLIYYAFNGTHQEILSSFQFTK